MLRKLLPLVLVAAGFYGGWELLSPDPQAPQQEPAKLSVTVVTPQQKSLTDEFDVTGMTVAREDVQVFTELSDVRVKDVYADVGDVVRQGQRLAVLDGEALGNRQMQFRADYDRAADAYRRVEALKAAGAVSQQMVTEARTTYQSAKAQLADARLNLRRSIVTAPAAGVITERKVAIGALVNPDEPLYRIAKAAEVELEADVPEAELSKVKIGRKARILVSGDGRTLSGAVRLVTPRIDPATRTAKVRIALENSPLLPVGLFASVRIAIGEVRGYALPATAIQTDDAGDYVWRVNARSSVERFGVNVLTRTDQYAIVQDIPPQSRIIARAGAFVKEGDVVQVVRR